MIGDDVSYPNLEAEMARKGITCMQIAEEIGIGRSTLSLWMNGAGAAFPIKKAMEVRDKFFEGQSIDYLFSEDAVIITT